MVGLYYSRRSIVYKQLFEKLDNKYNNLIVLFEKLDNKYKNLILMGDFDAKHLYLGSVETTLNRNKLINILTHFSPVSHFYTP